MTLRKPEGQCIACGSLPDDTEDRVPCDFCHFGVDDFPPAHVRVLAEIGERVSNAFVILAALYLAFKIAAWILHGAPVTP